MLKAARDWLVRSWWGIVVSYAIFVAATYVTLWAIAEPLNLPDKFARAQWMSTRWFYHVVLSLFIGSHLTILFELIHRKQLWTRADAPKLLPTREEYLREQIAALRTSSGGIALFTSKMHRSDELQDAHRVNEVLAAASRRGIKPRVLVALAETRLPGAIELARNEIAAVRFDPTLYLSDVNYLCVDGNVAVVGHRDFQGDAIGYTSSRAWYSVTSRTLANSLTRHFDDRWGDYGTVTIEQMLRLYVPRNVRTHGSKRVAESLSLSVDTVEKYASVTPLLILLVGKPGSGKTSAARTLVQRLNSSTLPAYHVSDLDYVRDKFKHAIETADGTVEATKDGGFRVLDSSIWDAADEHVADAIAKLPPGTLIGIVELARKSYQRTLDRLSAKGIWPDLVAYLDSPFELARKRNLMRRDFDRGHYVSEAEMELSYKEDDFAVVARNGRVDTSRIGVEQTVESVAAEVYAHFRDTLDRKFLLRRS